jgi:hypothetical protein
MLAILLAVALASWPRGLPAGNLEGAGDLPAALWHFGSGADLALHGPDAGYWAEAARDLVTWGEVDCQRMPVFPRAIALATRLGADVVFAGHLVGHVAAALSVLLTWALARLIADRGAALGAALLVALCPVLVNAQALFGVDTTYRAAVLAAAIGVVLALRGAWWRGLLAGLGLGLCGGTHYLGLLWPLPVSLLLFAAPGRWPARLGRALGCAGVALGVLVLLRPGCPFFSADQVAREFSVGIATSIDRSDLFERGLGVTAGLVAPQLLAAAAATLPHNLGDLAGRPSWAPLLVLLCLLGLAGPHPGRKPSWEGRVGLGLLLLLLPLVGLEASDAPQRYRNYAGPLLWVLVARGGGSLLAWLDLGLRRRWPRWPAGALGFVASAGVVLSVQGAWRAAWHVPEVGKDLHDRRLGALVRERFPEARCLVGLTAEAVFFAAIPSCPTAACGADAPGWRLEEDGMPARDACLEGLSRSCGVAPAVPYVVETSGSAGLPVPLAPAMDAWVLAHGVLVGEVRTEARHSRIFALPCTPAVAPLEGAQGAQLPYHPPGTSRLQVERTGSSSSSGEKSRSAPPSWPHRPTTAWPE